MAESIEYRPPTKSQKPNIEPASIPKAATASALVETATMWRATAPSPRASVSQSRTTWALAMVSRVVKVLDDTTTRVVAGSRPERARSASAPSTLAMNRAESPAAVDRRSASAAIFGPRNDPPIPMFTIVVSRSPVTPRHAPERTASVKSPIDSSTAATSAATSWPSTTSDPPGGIRRAMCRTRRSSDVLIRSPRNMASRRASTPVARARSSRCSITPSSTRFFDRSAQIPATS